MLISQILESIAAPSGIVTAYHGGTGFEGNFNLKFSGSGEGYRLLGPGIYFMTKEKAYAVNYAKKYAKSNPTVYTCEIDVTDFVINTHRASDALESCWKSLAADIGVEYEKLNWNPQNSLRNGRGRIGGVVQLVGHNKARDLFIKHGIKGSAEHIDEGSWELCVFDLRVVNVLGRELVTT